MRRAMLAGGVLALAVTPRLDAAVLTITRSNSVVADQVSAANPKALPGATIDFKLLVSNTGTVVIGPSARAIVITDDIPTAVKLSVTDLGTANSGPIELRDGSLLGTGLLASGVSLTYSGLGSASDGVEFYNGVTWNYTPVADATGCDPAVRKLRITLTGAQSPGTAFQLRYRVVVR